MCIHIFLWVPGLDVFLPSAVLFVWCVLERVFFSFHARFFCSPVFGEQNKQIKINKNIDPIYFTTENKNSFI
jgi:hypothetical protein